MLRRSLLLLTIPLFWVSSARAQKEPDFQGHPLHELIADLKAAAPMTRNAAAYSIAGIGPAAAPAVPALIEALHMNRKPRSGSRSASRCARSDPPPAPHSPRWKRLSMTATTT